MPLGRAEAKAGFGTLKRRNNPGISGEPAGDFPEIPQVSGETSPNSLQSRHSGVSFRPPRGIPGSRFVMKITPLFVLPAIAGCMLAACGTGAKVHNNQQASVGQQLTDLNRAHREGIITEKEYQKLRRAIIRKND